MPASDLLSTAYFGNVATHTPTSFGDIAAARFSQTFLDDVNSPFSTDYYLRLSDEGRAFSERNALIRQRFARDIVQEVREEFPQAGASFLVEEYQKRTDALIDEGRATNMENWRGIRKREEIESVIVDKAQVAEIEAQRATANAESDVASIAGNFVGGLGSLIDPINIATIPLGAGAARGVLKAAAVDGVINMGVETIQAPTRAEWMRDIGFKYGLSEIAADIATAGVGGAGLSALIRGGSRALGKLTGQSERVLRDIAADPVNGSEVRAAASYMERVAHLDENIPAPRVADEASHYEIVAAHRANAQETQDAFRNYREPAFVEDIPFDVPAAPRAPAPQARAFDQGTATGSKYENYTRPTPQEKSYMESAVAELEQAEAGALMFTERDGQGSTPDIMRARDNTFPAWFKAMNREGESLSREYVKKAFEKFSQGKPLGKKEIRVARALFDEARGLREENARQILNFRADRSAGRQQAQAEEIDAIAAREEARELADPYLEPAPQAAARIAEDVKAGAESEMMDAAYADFERLVDEDPNFAVVMEDGSTRTVAELADELAADGDILEAVTVCGVG